MTLMQLFGAMFIAYGPALALFLFTIAKEPLRIIVMMAGMFFWLCSLLVSSLLWFIVWPLKSQIAFGLTFSILFQEIFRFIYYKILRKAEDGLQQFNQTTPEQQQQEQQRSNNGSSTSDKTRHGYAYVAGLGFGVMSGIFSFINVLADSKGPGTVGIHGDPHDFLLTSAFLTSCFILLHIMWNVIFYWGFETRRYWAAAVVVLSHFLVSELTLLNRDQLYTVTLPVAYATLAVMSLSAFFIAGGSSRSLRQAFSFQRSRYAL